MKKVIKKIAELSKTILWMIFNPKFLVCFGLGWMITNGWSYIAFGVGMYYGIEWLAAVASGYLALLWIPATPEKLITVTLAIFFLRLFFPNDKKTLGVLKELRIATKRKIKQRKGEKSMRYDTVILGSGYFAVGYAQNRKNTLIIEETQLLDPNFYGRLSGFDMTPKRPTAKGAAALFDALEKEGVVRNGKLAVNELEAAFCRFVSCNMPNILFGTFCTRIDKKAGGYELEICNNEGMNKLFAKKVIDARLPFGNKLNLLLATDNGKLPELEGVAPAFYDDQCVMSLTFEEGVDINAAKSTALELVKNELGEAGARIVSTSYRLCGSDLFETHDDENAVTHVDERSFGDIFAAYEKGETWK